ncbi:enoyl-CoA hydratase/isomerase family protein [Streptomyces sp. NPDC056227]|uniref:enoyl-CoA hydratase/isomerase family protein n=1 Tax=Streptomyces sp. NPDC056227 TaxID=3345753 RepID=UPI0035D78449
MGATVRGAGARLPVRGALLARDRCGEGPRKGALSLPHVCRRSFGIPQQRPARIALATTHAVTIARLHGGVIGAGLGLAIFCDLRVGADTFRFRMPELGLGVPPAWGGVRPRLLAESGAAKVRGLILTADTFDAVRATELSILHKAVPEDELDSIIVRWTKPLVRRSPAALRSAEVMLNAYAGAARLADASLFDAELLTASVAAQTARAP